jgi:hypothetical protein
MLSGFSGLLLDQREHRYSRVTNAELWDKQPLPGGTAAEHAWRGNHMDTESRHTD